MLRVNAADRVLRIELRATLLNVLRNDLGLTGAKKACDMGNCGAGTVLLDDRRPRWRTASESVHRLTLGAAATLGGNLLQRPRCWPLPLRSRAWRQCCASRRASASADGKP